MKSLHMFKKRIPLLLTVFCCIVAAAISGTVNLRGNAKEAAVGAVPKQVIVIDAGHGACVLT